MNDNLTQIYHGHIIHTPTFSKFEIIENGYIIVYKGIVKAIYKTLPFEYLEKPINNFKNKLIIPSFNDFHIHASQYPNRGLCLDDPLILWLEKCTYPLEAKYVNLEYAKKVYTKVIHDLWEHGNLRSLIYNTIHYEATKLLFDMFVKSGLSAYIGKINMDINSPDELKEDTIQSLIDTERFIINTQNVSDLVKPIIAPRFVPSCSADLLKGLGILAKKYHVPVMSHLSEEREEVKIVKKMYPQFPTYADIYNYFGLLGQEPTVMAHCVYSDEEEQVLLQKNGVWVAHCPSSNFNLGSGMMKVREFLNKGIKVGLGCDVSGGGDLSLLTVMKDAIATSKIVSLDTKLQPLKIHEAFYLATKGGGSFFGNVGSFEIGNDFDALVINDTPLLNMHYNIKERIERFIYIGGKNNIEQRYVKGKNIVEPPNIILEVSE